MTTFLTILGLLCSFGIVGLSAYYMLDSLRSYQQKRRKAFIGFTVFFGLVFLWNVIQTVRFISIYF